MSEFPLESKDEDLTYFLETRVARVLFSSPLNEGVDSKFFCTLETFAKTFASVNF